MKSPSKFQSTIRTEGNKSIKKTISNSNSKSKSKSKSLSFNTNSINSSNSSTIKSSNEYSNISPQIIKAAENYFLPRNNEEEMPFPIEIQTNVKYYNLEQIFNCFYPENSLSIAKDKSREERENKGITDKSFIYGEVTFRSIAFIYEFLKKELGKNILNGNFYDLGSGTGKAVLAFGLLRPFTKCIGIEFLENLFTLSNEMKFYYEKNIEDIFLANENLFEDFYKHNTLTFINGDFLKENWNDASIILANSTCFSQELMTKIAIKANNDCKKGTIIITFTKKLIALNNQWQHFKSFKRLMTWGIATIFIYRKKV